MTDESELDSENGDNRKSLTPWLWAGGLAMAAAIGIAMATSGGPDWSDDRAAEAGETAAEPAQQPAQTEAEAPPEPDIRGVIKPKKESTIASKMTARITSMPFGQGRSFRRGALLARFDCSATQAQLKAARAAANAYSVTYETNVELDQYEAIGKNEVAVSRANLGKAQAEANAIEATLSDCAVYAPFSGTVVEQMARRGEVAASGQPLLKIQSGGDLEVELIVPSNWLNWLRPGAKFTFAIDETGADITGQVTRLGASVDPVSKTIRVTGNVDRSDGLVLPGMSGTATFADKGELPAPQQPVTEEPATAETGAETDNDRKPG